MFVLLPAFLACHHPSSGSGPATPPPSTPPVADTCLHSIETPTDPEPEAPCRTESFSSDGTLLRRVEVHSSAEDGLTGTVTLTYVGGELVLRESVVEGPNGMVFDAFEHLEIPADGTLPQTYGMPATVSVTTVRDASGNAVNERVDQAMDGSVDTEYARAFDGDQLIEETRWDAGVLAYYRTLRSDGRPLLTRATGGEEVTWTYDNGLLTLEEHTPASGEPVVHSWVERSPGVPESHDVHRGSQLIATHTWTYDAQDRLRRHDSTRQIGPGEETILVEYDTQGHKIHEQAWSWDPNCSDFDRHWTLLGDVVVAHTSKCDGQERGSIVSEVDAEGRLAHSVRTWIGGTVEDRFTYDACGALTLREASQDGSIVRTETWERDDLGRLVSATDQRPPSDAVTSFWSWGADGELLERTGATFTMDTERRLIQVEYETGIRETRGSWGALALDEPTHTLQFSYSCDEPGIID